MRADARLVERASIKQEQKRRRADAQNNVHYTRNKENHAH